MMMKRLWLAVVLGGILGLGIAVVPGSIAPEQKTSVQPATLASQLAASSISPSLQFQSILWGLLAGVIVAFPVFVLVRRRL